MKKMVKEFFKVDLTFEVPNSESKLGVVFHPIKWETAKHVAFANDVVPALPPGSIFEIECEVTEGGTMRHPQHIHRAWMGRLGSSSSGILKNYLTALYSDGLQDYEKQTRPVPKSYLSADVFATPILVLLETLHNTLNVTPLHTLLEARNYQLYRPAVYTRLEGADTAFNTPRKLRYYPKINTIDVEFIVENYDNVPKEMMGMDSIVGDTVHIVRYYTNESWLSLRDLCKRDKKVDTMVRSLIEQEFMHPRPAN